MNYGTRGALLQRQFGFSYFLATLLLPARLRHHVFALYGMVRMADNFVDSPAPAVERKKQLLLYKQDVYEEIVRLNASENPTAKDFARLLNKFGFHPGYLEAFFGAMEKDTDPSFQYCTYEDLEKYMYGSAVVIGYMMSEIIGYQEEALPYAKKLAEAMQLTNFLRDVKEDWEQFGRIYIPETDLSRFGLARESFIEGDKNENFRHLIQFEVERAKVLYKESAPGIALLHKDGQKAVRMASLLYQKILRNIEDSGYRPWSVSAKTSFWQKLRVFFQAL